MDNWVKTYRITTQSTIHTLKLLKWIEYEFIFGERSKRYNHAESKSPFIWSSNCWKYAVFLKTKTTCFDNYLDSSQQETGIKEIFSSHHRTIGKQIFPTRWQSIDYKVSTMPVWLFVLFISLARKGKNVKSQKFISLLHASLLSPAHPQLARDLSRRPLIATALPVVGLFFIFPDIFFHL